MVSGLSAQTVKGNVKDTNGEPIIGVTVQEKGTKNVAVTDLDGNFSIKTTGDGQLQFSYIGMKAKTVNAAGKSNITLYLKMRQQILMTLSLSVMVRLRKET